VSEPPEFDELVELAVGRGLAYLGRRDRTVAETRQQLFRRGFESEVVELALDRLREMGYLDDFSFAERFSEDRRRLDGWGTDRIVRRLRELGAAPDAIMSVAKSSDGETDLQQAIELLERRLQQPADTDSDRRRAMGILVRRGYSPEIASDAIREHRRSHA
jgi:regulatory protein